MAKRSSSTAALNDILPSSESDDENDESVYSDESDVGSDDSGSEGQDCEIVESLQNCDENEALIDENRLRNTPSTSAVSLLNVLKAPRQSDLARKRKVVVNAQFKGKRPASGRSSKATVKIKPDQRIREYCDEHLTVSNGKLFCEACRGQLTLKKSSINSHVQSAKHKDRKVKLHEKEKRDQTIVQALLKYNETHHL